METFFIIAIGAALAFFVMVQRSNKFNRPFLSASIPSVDMPLPTEAPQGPFVSEMDSPEGSKKLTLETQAARNSLFVSSKPDGQKEQIFNKEEYSLQTLEIPFNTWSTDNKYVFLREKTPSQNNYFVFQSSGELFSNDSPFVSVQDHFKEKVPSYLIEDVTGWAGNTSLIVNAKEIGGEGTVSFWFEVPSQSFIRLGTYFK